MELSNPKLKKIPYIFFLSFSYILGWNILAPSLKNKNKTP